LASSTQKGFGKQQPFKGEKVKERKCGKETLEEIRYLESLEEHLSKADGESDIDEIHRELIDGGYAKRASVKGKSKQQLISKSHHYISSDGYDIYVGKNNLQNDELTLRFASAGDLWLHTKVIPGSHVIVKSKGKDIPERTLLEAAQLAAWYSKARQSANVPVDYCPRKNVKKPGGAKPGMVIYEHYNTIYVTPSEEDIHKIPKAD
jgi:predicted ribosome quality control (RQC) complex YloA/Tae2 family protein